MSRVTALKTVSLVALLMSASACGSGGASNGSSKSPIMTVAITPVSTSVCVEVTQERGEFKSKGLDVKLTPAPPTSAAQIAQVINGQVTVGLGAYTGVVSAVANNLPVVITNASDYDFNKGGQTAFSVLVAKDSTITSFKELEGKTVAVNSLQGTWELALRQAIEDGGGDPSKVKLTAVSFSDQGTALKSGRVDAILTLQPLIASLTAEGLKSIGDPFAVVFGKPDSASAVLFMSKKFVTDNASEAKTFVETLQEGDKWCNAHPKEMSDALARITKIPAAVLAKAPLPDYGAKIDPAETESWAKLLVKYGVIKEAPATSDVQWSDAPTK